MIQKLKKIARLAYSGITILLLAGCLLACLSPFLNPGKFAIIGLLGIGFPFLFLAVLINGCYWYFKKSKWAWVHLAVLLAGLFQLSSVFGFHLLGGFTETKAPASIRVLSWNLSSWGITKRNNERKINFRSEMTDILVKANADVICLQEYSFVKEKTFRDSVIPELEANGYHYFFFARSKYTMRLYRSAHVTGVAIASKYPIKDTARFNYADDDFAEPLIYADIQVNNNTVRVFTTHLQSVRFEAYDYEALHNLKEPASASITQSRAIAWKLKQAYKKRAAQAELVSEKIKESAYPVVLCGDFNDVPGSYTYTVTKGNLQDAFLKTGFGFGRTYRFLSPTLRIDYILVDKSFTVNQYKKIEVPYSDHYPIVADISANH